MVTQAKVQWTLLNYRIPREPSTPRIAIWRRLKDLGVVQIGDGLVALPDNDQTREQLEWVAAQVIEADGEAIVWTASPTTRADSDRLIAEQRAARNAEYEALQSEIAGATRSVDTRTVARWRRELRRITRRDHFNAASRDATEAALHRIVGADANEVAAR